MKQFKQLLTAFCYIGLLFFTALAVTYLKSKGFGSLGDWAVTFTATALAIGLVKVLKGW